MRILNFKDPRELVDYSDKRSQIDKLRNMIIKANCRFVYDQLKNNLPETFSNFFILNTQLPKQSTRKNRLILSKVKATSYGSSSIIVKAIKQWNEIRNFIKLIFILPK